MWFIVLISKRYRQLLCDYIAHTSIQTLEHVTYLAKYPNVLFHEFLYHVSGCCSDNTDVDTLFDEAYQLIKDYQANCDLVQLIRVADYFLHRGYFIKTDT